MKVSLRFAAFFGAFCISFVAYAQSAVPALADMDPVEVAKLSVSRDTIIPGSIELIETSLTIAPRPNELWIQYSDMVCKLRFCLGPEARAVIREAGAKYLNEYEAHTLNAKKNMTHAYGKTNIKYEWGTMAFNALAHPSLSMGYRFVNKSPYFTLLIPVSANERYNIEGSTIKQTGEMRLYFTRAQLETLVAALDNAAIEAAVAEMVKENAEAMPDAY
jgi:hypothetical protein